MNYVIDISYMHIYRGRLPCFPAPAVQGKMPESRRLHPQGRTYLPAKITKYCLTPEQIRKKNPKWNFFIYKLGYLRDFL